MLASALNKSITTKVRSNSVVILYVAAAVSSLL